MQSPHIVVIDGDPLVHEALKALLQAEVPVVGCHGGEAAVTSINDHTEAVVLDVMMASKEGLETCKEIRKKHEHVPVIFYSTYRDLNAPPDIINRLRPFAYVSKGGNSWQLYDTVRSTRSAYQQYQENRRLVQLLQELNQELEQRVMERTRTLEEALQENQLLSMTDSLTNVPNRRQFLAEYAQQLNQAARTKRPFALLVVDIDNFKQINDGHGHMHGDAVLEKVAHVLQDNLRSIDALGRIGGDEFALALPETDVHGARQVGERLQRGVDALSFVPRDSTQPHKVTLSIGGCVLGDEAPTDPDLFFHSADRALFDSKRAGRNRVSCVLYTALPPPQNKRNAARRTLDFPGLMPRHGTSIFQLSRLSPRKGTK